ncbi:universal stress protein, partial [Saccharopolyspora sp. NPDC002686]|uniref:universal stress protein n=1 Tax=Saccharopolyspora sp. NPDC002686 TaxID=3154541 RepID=UPI00331E7930
MEIGCPISIEFAELRRDPGHAKSAAQRLQADILVVGNKGHGAFTGMLVGSVALKLVHHAA